MADDLSSMADTVFAAEVTPPQPDPQTPAEPEPQAPDPQPEAPQPAPDPAPEPQPQPDEPRHIPLAAHLDERDRRKAAERERDELRQQMQQRQANPRPDPLDDPEGFNAYYAQQLDARLAEQRFQFSDLTARRIHGAEKVDRATEWANDRAARDPAFAVAYMREADPIDWIVRQHQRDALLSDIGDDVDDWFTREATKRGYVPQSAIPAVAAPVAATTPQAPAPAVPPRSLVNAPSSGGIDHVPTGLKAGVEAVFPR